METKENGIGFKVARAIRIGDYIDCDNSLYDDLSKPNSDEVKSKFNISDDDVPF